VTLITYSARSDLLCSMIAPRRIGRIENDLGDAVPIAQVDEEAAAVVAVAIDPSAQSDPRGRCDPFAIRTHVCVRSTAIPVEKMAPKS